MFKKYLLQLKIHHLRALREQKGQSLIIFVFAILGIIAMMGLALDLGLVYIERVRVSRTTDAAALASVVELPFEEEAMRRAIEYINLNGYTQQDTEIRVRGCINEPHVNKVGNVGEGSGEDIYPPNGNPQGLVRVQPTNLITGYVYQPSLTYPPRNIFVIDTLAYQPVERDAAGDVTSYNEENCDGGSSPLYGTANKLRVTGQVNVDMNFMQFFGRGTVAVSDQAVGENVTNLDVVVVFDISGSMDYDTNCFGCWTKGLPGDPNPDIMSNPYPKNGLYAPLGYHSNEDNGDYSIFWQDSNTSVSGHAACSALPASKQFVEDPTGPSPGPTYNYLVHEAEFYSRNGPKQNGWEFPNHTAGEGFWVLQRSTPAENASNNAYISAHPFVTYSQAKVEDIPQIQGGTYNSDCFAENPDVPGDNGPYGDCWASKGKPPEESPNDPPYVEYDFTPDWTGQMNIWIRAMGSWSWSFEWDGANPTNPPITKLAPYRTGLFWQLDNGPVTGGADVQQLLGRKFRRNEIYTTTAAGGKDRWRWVKIAGNFETGGAVAGQKQILRFYEGSSGFNIDKIIITNNPEGVVGTTLVDDGRTVLQVTSDTAEPDGRNAGTATVLDSNANKLNIAKDVLSLFDGKGPDVTDGSATREACNRCNPEYGQDITNTDQCTCRQDKNATGAGSLTGCTFLDAPTNQVTNDLFYDKSPLRNAKEAVKHFSARLDPKFDQLGVVSFSNNTPNRTKLQCLVFAGFDRCVSGSTPITYSFVIKDIEDYDNTGATNIAQGLREGLEELGVSVKGYNNNVGHDCPNVPNPISNSPSVLDDDDKEACDRRGAARRILVLMTDGTPSRWPGYDADPGNCPGNADALWQGQIGAGNQGYDCAIFYAQEAADHNIALFVIGIGAGVNDGFLKAMATGTDDMGTKETSDDIVYFKYKGGAFYNADTPDKLDAIFEKILSNIYVRIVG